MSKFYLTTFLVIAVFFTVTARAAYVPNPVSSIGRNFRVESAVFSVSSACTSSPCLVAASTGAWYTSLTRSSTGTYTLNIPAGTFSAVPVCVVQTSAIVTSTIAGQTATAFTIVTQTAAGFPSDSAAMNFICMGPR